MLSFKTIEDMPESVYASKTYPADEDVSGRDCCNFCFATPNCVLARFQPAEGYSCNLTINVLPFPENLVGEQCPSGFSTKGDPDDGLPDWSQNILGPCFQLIGPLLDT